VFHIMQKHRRIMMVFIFVFIGIPLAVWVPGASNSGNTLSKGDPILNVDGTDIYAFELLGQYNDEVSRRTAQDRPTDASTLIAEGVVANILNGLIQREILAQKASVNPVIPEKEYVFAKFKDHPFFKNEEGEFVASKYNNWVKANDRGGMNWDDFAEGYAQDISREMYSKLVTASARINETELRDEYLKSQRKIKVKYITVAPEIKITEEEILAEHTDNAERYNKPPENIVEFVRLSIQPPIPTVVNEVLTKARAGEDFAELAKAHSVGADKEIGGDMDWRAVSDNPVGQEQHYINLNVGEISEPIQLFSEVYLYKVAEERTNEETQELEKRVNRIVFRIDISPEFRTEIDAKADALLAQVAESKDLRAAAATAELTVETSTPFNAGSSEIDGISANDTFAFKQGFGPLDLDGIPETVVAGSENLFVGKVIQVTEASPQALEDVREEVKSTLTRLKKSEPVYLEKIQGYMDTIQSEAKSLDEVAVLLPDLTIEVKETKTAFGPQGMELFQEGLFWNVRAIFPELGDKEVGTIITSIQDFQQNQLAMELSEIVEPDAEVFEKDWTEQKELMLENVHQRVKFARQTDYATFLAQEAMNGGKVMQYDDVINEVIGAYDENEEEASSDEETDGEITVVDDAPSVTEPSPEEPVEETTAQ